jgi:hypothetical protein
MAEKPTDGLFKRLGRGFDRYIGGLLGEDLESMTPEERANARRQAIGAIGRSMMDPASASEQYGAVTQARAQQRARGELARRTAAAEARMPDITSRIFGGLTGTTIEALPGAGGEAAPLTARRVPTREGAREALSMLYGTQEGRDAATMAPGLVDVAKEGVTGRIVGGSVYDTMTGRFDAPRTAPEPRTLINEIRLGDRVIAYFSDGTSQEFEVGMEPGARARGGGGGAGGGAGGGGEESFGKEDATTLRKEATTQLSEYQKFGDAWGRVQEAAMNPSPANDIALIFAYMKILDPTSVVREGEFATAANAGSIPQRVWARYNKLMRGEELNAEQRNDFLSSAYGLVRSQHRNAQRIVDRYGNLAAGYGVNPKAVAENPLAWAIAPKVSNQQEFDRLAPGTLFEDATTGKLKVKPR